MVANGKHMKCEICGKTVYVQKYRWDTFRFCSHACRGKHGSTLTTKGRFKKGGKGFTKKHSKETKAKISKARTGKCLQEDNPSWKGGITPQHVFIRKSKEYKIWRKAVFERDNYTCVWCGDRQKAGHQVTLQADHIKPFAYYPELRFAIDNGRTLCVSCHRKTDTFGHKAHNHR